MNKLGVQGDMSRYILHVKLDGQGSRALLEEEVLLPIKQQALLSGKQEPTFLIKRAFIQLTVCILQKENPEQKQAKAK